MSQKIYTHDEAMLIVAMFENVLSEYDICVPSPEDDDRDPDDMVGLYGSTYGDLMDEVEDKLIEILKKHTSETEIIEGEFSGTV